MKPTPIFSVGDYGPNGAGAHVVHWEDGTKLAFGPDGPLRRVPKVSRFNSEPNGSFYRTDWRPARWRHARPLVTATSAQFQRRAKIDKST